MGNTFCRLWSLNCGTGRVGCVCGTNGKGNVLAKFSSLVGVRGEGGFEFATGANISASGLGFVFAAGYNIRKGDFNLPINISIVPDKQGPKYSSIGDI